MIGERFFGQVQPGVRVGCALPHGCTIFSVRVDRPCTVMVLLDGRVAAQTQASGAPDDGDMPGSGYSLMCSTDGAREVSVEVDAATGVWGHIE